MAELTTVRNESELKLEVTDLEAMSAVIFKAFREDRYRGVDHLVEPYLTTDAGDQLGVAQTGGRYFLDLSYANRGGPKRFRVEVPPAKGAELKAIADANGGVIPLKKGWEASARRVQNMFTDEVTFRFAVTGMPIQSEAAGIPVEPAIEFGIDEATFRDVKGVAVGIVVKYRRHIELGKHPRTQQPVVLEVDEYLDKFEGRWVVEFGVPEGLRLAVDGERHEFGGDGGIEERNGEYFVVLPGQLAGAAVVTEDERFKSGSLATADAWPEGRGMAGLAG